MDNPEKPESVDVFLISFPKCGRTWLRLMLGRAIANHFALEHPDILSMILKLEPLATLHPDIPKFLLTHEGHMKTPDELVETKAEFKNAKVIFLVRDPRDAIVSNYFQKTKRWQNKKTGVYEGSISAYIRDERGSLETLLKYYNIWANNRQIPQSFMVVRYEDMQRDAQTELRRVLSFVGLQEVSDRVVNEAVEFASFDNMRRMELEGNLPQQLKPVDVNDPESFKTRKGKVEGYKEYLSQEDIEYINQRMKEVLSKESVELYKY